MRRLIAILLLLCFAAPAYAQSVSPCNMGQTGSSRNRGANYSATIDAGQWVLIPAPKDGAGARTGIFIELLSASATLGINPGGGTASTSAAGNIVISTGAAAPNNVAYINMASLGFIPQGAITATADSSGRVVSAWACPE